MRQLLTIAACSILQAAVLLPDSAQACSVCPGPNLGGLVVDHPEALKISIATYRALQSKLLPPLDSPAASESSAEGKPSLGPEMTPGWVVLRQLASGENPPTVAELLLVDKGFRRLLVGRGEKQRLPQIRVVTTVITLHALLKQQITLQQAVEAGLILIEPLDPFKPAETPDAPPASSGPSAVGV